MTETDPDDTEIGMGDTVYDPKALGFGVVVTVDSGVASVNVSDPSGAFRADVPTDRLELVEAKRVPSYNPTPDRRPFSDHQ
jgi:hypothetical protein